MQLIAVPAPPGLTKHVAMQIGGRIGGGGGGGRWQWHTIVVVVGVSAAAGNSTTASATFRGFYTMRYASNTHQYIGGSACNPVSFMSVKLDE